MKKATVLLVITFVMMFCFVGCKAEKDLKVNKIEQLEVWCAMENEADIYHIRYPHYYCKIHSETSKCSIYDFENAIARENLSEEDYIYLTDYVMNLESSDHDAEDIGTYRIYLHYYDENGVKQSKAVYGYNDFPEGWSEFISRVNTICGDEYLSCEGDIVEVTPEFLTDKFDVTDEDVKEGTLADVIEQNKLDIFEVTESGFNMEFQLEKYYAGIKEDAIAPFRPTQLDMVDCTSEEYNAFIEEYLSELGGEWEELESDQQHLRYFHSTTDARYFYIGKSADLGLLDVEYDDVYGYYNIFLDAHMEDMSIRTDFYYSINHKFILVDVSDTDMLLAYIGVGAGE
ncbi:MAG: hypothetical protein IJ397_03195 [Lachnospiraceae bacterium]|nr:hypothetical protein [Lachnospiraceae bacterium]